MAERILVVDDEPEVCRALDEFLTMKGYEVATARDGPTALQTIEEFRPRVVLLDVIMPGMGGIEVLKQIRKTAPQLAVVMITAVLDQEIGNRTLKLGASDYITKPVDLKYLETVLMVKIISLLE